MGVGCRVEPMVTHPAPPQTRTCAMNAYGSSSRATAALYTVQWGSGDTIGEHKVSLVCLPTGTLCSTSPSLPWVPWASVPHLPRYYATLRLPPCPSRVASLVARFPIPCVLLWFVVSPQGSLPGRSAQTAPGLLVTRSPHSGYIVKETDGSPKFPSSPCEDMPRSQTPVVSCALAIAHPGLLPSSACKPSAYHDYTHFGAQSRGLPSRYTRLRTALYREARGFATDLLARRSSGRT